jgi:hypothetical protein
MSGVRARSSWCGFASRALALSAVLVVARSTPSAAQPPTTFGGYTSLMLDLVPGAPGTADQPDGTTELRARVLIETRTTVSEHLTLRASAWAEGLAGERFGRSAREATVQPHDLTLAWASSRVDVTAGVGQVVWGRLDEFQPTDVVNPIDVTRFFLEGRAEARRSVGLVRARAFLPRDTTLDTVYVPFFRPATFDMLGNRESPFTLAPRDVAVPGLGVIPIRVLDDRPGARFGNAQGGARLSSTTGRIDWALMAWRGFEAVPLYQLSPATPRAALAVETTSVHPRTTVVGGDFETVRGAWGVRGEVAWHVDDTLQATDRFAVVRGRSVDAGVGVDRRAGDYRVSLTALTAFRSRRDGRTDGGAIDRRDVQLVTSVDRNFAGDTRRLRVFGVYNPQDESAFVRGIGSWSIRDGWWIEASGGWLTGSSTDTLSRLAERDFAYVRARVYF